MDRSYRKTKKEKKAPRTPIKTYKWEDIRRARKKGGYPWTYLYKQPFNEELHLEGYTMEGLRKTKSTSTMGGKSFLTISEITEFDREGSATFDIENIDCTLQIIDEPDDHSMKTSAANSVIIEECEVNESENKKPEFLMDSAESSDDISQYLDKDERGPNKIENGEATLKSERKPGEIQVDEENKSDDDTSKRKRKLSAESSYSRLSQTKSAILKKIKDTKNKIKVPKISLPTRLKKPVPKKQKTSPSGIKKEMRKTNGKNVKPVYIHIPLKPPPGETDEFSYLEFEDTLETTTNKKPVIKPGSFKDLVKCLKQLKENKSDTQEIQEVSKDDKKYSEESKETTKEILSENLISSPKDNEETTTKTDDYIKDIGTKNENDTQSRESRVIIKNTSSGNAEIDQDQEKELVTDPMDEAEERDIIFPKIKMKDKKIMSTGSLLDPKNQIIEVSDEQQESNKTNFSDLRGETDIREEIIEDNDDKPEESNQKDIFDGPFLTTTSKTGKKTNTPGLTQPRSKSVEPEKQRKLSVESSYSRKSLSELRILKKFKGAADKIKSIFSRSDSTKQRKLEDDQLEKENKEAENEFKKAASKFKLSKNSEPVYIRIPLKLPEGQIDDLSYLENNEKQSSEDELVSPTDSTLQGNDVQLIILTAPSDDEILDYHSSDVAETPSSETKMFFNDKKVDELKVIAKGAVHVMDHYKPNHTLESVTEESGCDRISVEESILKKEPDGTETTLYIKPGKLNDKIVDIEDGLSETKSVDKKGGLQQGISDEVEDEIGKTSEIKSSLKGDCSSLKKKVSFKRRSKTPKNESYEDIKAPVSEVEGNLVLDQSAPSAETDTAHLDGKVISNASVEDDYKEWSTINDHEYEPVNPPPDNSIITPTLASPITTSVFVEDPDPDDSILPLGSVPFNKLIHSSTAKIVGETLKQDAQPYKDDRQRTPPIVTFTPAEEITPPTLPIEKNTKHGPNRFQIAFKQKSDNIKNKLHNIKKPNIHLPNRPKFNKPNFSKFKFEKPKINLPNIPDKSKMNLPYFSLPAGHTAKRPLKERKLSTESNAGDSKKSIFSFNTYPRFFKRKPKVQDESKNFATVPRSSTKTDSNTVQTTSEWSGSDSIRIPLHSEDSMDEVEYRQEVREIPKETYDEDLNENIEPSHIRYEQDIDNDDEYERGNNGIKRDRYFLNRWDHGRFNREDKDDYIENYRNSEKITDLDSPEEVPNKSYDLNANTRDNYSSSSSHGAQGSGVLEEINSDEFLWRQKGISQEDMDIRMYLSSEIKEAFKMPNNALAQMDDSRVRHYNLRDSNQSLPEPSTKKKSIKKPKRKKTPQASQEQISYTGDSGDENDEESSPPSRPRRHSRRLKKNKNADEIIPYQDTISVDTSSPEKLLGHRESLGGILGDDEGEEKSIIYKKEKMTRKEQPGIRLIDPYSHMEFSDGGVIQEIPATPQRKHRSLKSLASENDSILDDLSPDLESEITKTDSKLIIPIQSESPRRPTRTISRTSSESRGTSQKDAESLSRRTDSSTSEQQIPFVEEPCFQDLRDCMGYAIVDKSRTRDPPLPPPRALRRKRSLKAKDDAFFTVPLSHNEHAPTRPLRNYSTLVQIRNAMEPNIYENKENVDITGYVEIEDEPNKDLLKGEVIKKMKDRPLPAPPRPPRKSRLESRLLEDITSRKNIVPESEEEFYNPSGETETATQTEPLPEDFMCEEVLQEPTDIIIMPSKFMEQRPTIERKMITPAVYRYEETITHGSLLVEPLNGAKLLRDSEINEVPTEKVIPTSRESDIDETSSVTEECRKLQDLSKDTSDFEIMKAQKLQVTDLDVDTLTVNKLMAEKIVVSEIDIDKINTHEISSNSESLKVGDINLPPGVIEGIMQKLQLTSQVLSEQPTKKESPSEVDFDDKKKTSISEKIDLEKTNYLQDELVISENFTSEINVDISADYTQEEHPIPCLSPSSNNERLPISPVNNINKEISNDPHTIIDNTYDEFTLLQVAEPPIHQPRATNSMRNLEKENSELTAHLTNSPEHENLDSILPKSSDLECFEEKIENVTIPPRPPRQYEKNSATSTINQDNQIQEPEVDDEPPPRPPQPQLDYIPSQPPPSFYALRAQKYIDSLGENIPVVPRRRRHTKSRPRTRSSSDDSSGATPTSRYFHRRSSEPSIGQLSVQLVTACGSGVNNSLKRLITYIIRNVLGNEDGKQDLNVIIMIVLVLIAGLILLGYGDEKTVVHLHHWEYFNPPRDL